MQEMLKFIYMLDNFLHIFFLNNLPYISKISPPGSLITFYSMIKDI